MCSTDQLFLHPAPQLHDVIDHYWFSDVMGEELYKVSDHSNILLPDSCADWHFCYHNSFFETRMNGIDTGLSNSILAGTRSIDKVISMTKFSALYRGIRVRFKPLGFYKLFNIPAHTLHNTVCDAEAIWGNEINCLEARIEQARDHFERKEYLDQYFISALNKATPKSLKIQRCMEAYKVIDCRSGNIRLQMLVEQLGVNERSIERDFKTVLGLSPKELCATIRLNNIIWELFSKDEIRWDDLIYNNGYYDQSHFINDFKKATTITPDWFFKNKNKEILVTNGLLIFLKNDQAKITARIMADNYDLFAKEKLTNSLIY